MKIFYKLFFFVAFVLAVFIGLQITATAAETDSNCIDQVLLAEENLDEETKVLYNALKEKARSISSGESSSTTITFSSKMSSLSWTKEEIGCTLLSGNKITAAAKAAVNNKVNDLATQMFTIMLADLSHELFWFDKADGLSWSCKMTANNDEIYVTSITFKFIVSEDYRSSVTDKHTVDISKVISAKIFLANAQKIVDKHKEKNDVEKLCAYKDEICSLVTYNYDAANNSYAYGDPWQAVYVFDGDPDTNVVCEGYSKAFKYLCDLSDFEGDVYCYIVSGTTQVNNGKTGNHMWNVVKIGSNNYIVDVTNCEPGTIGAGTGLFLVGAEAADAGKTSVIQLTSSKVKYTYKDSQIDLFCDGYLPISSTSYHIHAFSTSWHIDGNYHWKECSCGIKKDISSHISSGSNGASCTSKAICDICNNRYGTTKEHIYNRQVTSNPYLHSLDSCSGIAKYYYSCACGARGTEIFEQYVTPQHTYSVRDTSEKYMQSPASCNSQARYYYSCICGAISTQIFTVGEVLEHVYIEAWCADEVRHWRECACGEKSHVSTHSSSGDNVASCVTQAICDICQKEYGAFEEHSYGETWLTNDQNHWRACSCGEISALSAHKDKDNSGFCDVCNLKNAKESISNTESGSVNTPTSSSTIFPDYIGNKPMLLLIICGISILSIVFISISIIVYFSQTQHLKTSNKNYNSEKEEDEIILNKTQIIK